MYPPRQQTRRNSDSTPEVWQRAEAGWLLHAHRQQLDALVNAWRARASLNEQGSLEVTGLPAGPGACAVARSRCGQQGCWPPVVGNGS
jgi:hypothetical protein